MGFFSPKIPPLPSFNGEPIYERVGHLNELIFYTQDERLFYIPLKTVILCRYQTVSRSVSGSQSVGVNFSFFQLFSVKKSVSGSWSAVSRLSVNIVSAFVLFAV